MTFRGEHIDPSIWEDCHGSDWMPWIELFLPMINNRHGFFQHLPFSGGYLEQPHVTMRILRTIQSAYYEYLAEVNKIGG